MANTSQSLLTLDFATYKASLKDYLKNNSVFKDYDFEGSNMAVLLDLLAYNTFQNGFYTNMALSESFLDSAQLRSSIVSHAKDLNYLPVSAKSSVGTVNVSFTATGVTTPYVIQKGSPFTSLIKNQSYVFNTNQSILAKYTGNSTYTFTASIYEGLYINDPFIMLSSNDPQRFKLTNQNIDTDSITVTVFENGSQSGDIYTATDTLLGLTPTSKIYFIQASADGYYEILFGDNIFGKQPLANALINVNYRVTVGADANGAKVFSCDFDPTNVGELLSTPVTTLVLASSNGNDKETIESIRVYAPRYFATQQRAVSSDDYASIVLAKFPNAIDDVNVYGGETLDIKQYGRVVVALKPKTGTVVPDYTKQAISNLLLNYIAVPNKIIIEDPEYFYLKVDSTVFYDPSITTLQIIDLQTAIQSDMSDFGVDNLQKFGRDFRYSRFVSSIDNSDESIVSNDTDIQLIKRLTPVINTATSYNIKFNNAIKIEDHAVTAFSDESHVTSSQFAFVDVITKQVFQNSYLMDDGIGNIAVFSAAKGTPTLINGNIGTVDYTNGIVQITDLIASDYSGYISLYVSLVSKDIKMTQKNILNLDLNDVNLTMTQMAV
jgi:hypothetical protein